MGDGNTGDQSIRISGDQKIKRKGEKELNSTGV
jgi:hypothetical protein